MIRRQQRRSRVPGPINPVADSYRDVVLADNPTGFWPLDETSGTTANDLSGNDLDGTYQRSEMVGGRTWMDFASPDHTGTTSDWVSVPADAVLSGHAGASGAWSFDGWFYDDGVSGTRMMLSVSSPTTYEVFVYRSSGGSIIVDVTQSNGTSITSTSVTAPASGQWYHFAYTYDRAAAVAVVYLDGVEVGSDTTMSGESSYTGLIWRIGGRGDDSGDRWDGSISHLAIYDTALSAGRVAAHAAAG